MNETPDLQDLDDDDDYELSPGMRSQFERFEQSHRFRTAEYSREKTRRLHMREKLADLEDARRLRDEIDYLN